MVPRDICSTARPNGSRSFWRGCHAWRQRSSQEHLYFKSKPVAFRLKLSNDSVQPIRADRETSSRWTRSSIDNGHSAWRYVAVARRDGQPGVFRIVKNDHGSTGDGPFGGPSRCRAIHRLADIESRLIPAAFRNRSRCGSTARRADEQCETGRHDDADNSVSQLRPSVSDRLCTAGRLPSPAFIRPSSGLRSVRGKRSGPAGIRHSPARRAY